MDDLEELIGRLRARLDEPDQRVDRWESTLTPLPPPATREHLDAVQIALGVGLPRTLRRILAQVADGGFGPGYGVLGSGDLIRITGRCRRLGEAAGGWPTDRLPVAELEDGALACIALGDPAAPVAVFDPHAVVGDGALADAFTPAAPSLVAWLTEWAAASVSEAG